MNERRRTAKSIVFARPIRDARGCEVSELTEDEATWELTVQRVVASVPKARDPMLVGATAQDHLAVFVPCYRVTLAPLADGRAVGLMVPVEHVVCVRQPLQVVELVDDDGKVGDKQLLPARAVAEMEAKDRADAALIRGDAPTH